LLWNSILRLAGATQLLLPQGDQGFDEVQRCDDMGGIEGEGAAKTLGGLVQVSRTG
jgi:hypothetical protein